VSTNRLIRRNLLKRKNKMQKVINVPEPVVLLGLDGSPMHKDEKQTVLEEPFDLERVIGRYVLVDPKVGSGRKAGQFVKRVMLALKNIKDGKLTVDEGDLVQIKDIINNPTDPEKNWPPAYINAQIEPFFEAIDAAS
jgi:hypothetical protein